LLSEKFATMSESLHLTKLLAKSENREAGRYFAAHRDALLEQQRALFLTAALTRSRFDKQGALLLFNTIYAVDPDTAAGQCALCMLKLDTTRRSAAGVITVGRTFQELRKVVAAHPDDIMIRWMLAVECRTWNLNAEGAQQYQKILESWDPGPALVHQTYANLLDNLGRYEEALKHRYITVRMEPAPWSFDGLGNTLDSLERYQEGCAAHWIAVRMNPSSASHLSNWGLSLCGNKQYDAAIEKCQQALQLQPTYFRAMWVWGKALAGKGDLRGALAKYEQAIALYPGELKMRQEAKILRDRISKGELTGARQNEPAVAAP
jgi:tetratricopeptide (TPR) repeat protein